MDDLEFNGDPTGFPLAIGFVHKRILGAAKGFVTSGFNPVAAAGGFLNPSAGGSSAPMGPPVIQRIVTGRGISASTGRPFTEFGCPGGTVPIPGTSRCVAPGDLFPGGAPGIVPRQPLAGAAPEFGVAVIGAFGMPALEPAIVGSITNSHGEVSPIRKCPRGSVLGKDDLCYMKIPNSFRKWPRAARAPVTAEDAKCIRRAASATRRVERLAKSVGLKTKRK